MSIHDPAQCLTCKATADPEDHKTTEVSALVARFAELRERFGPPSAPPPRKDIA